MKKSLVFLALATLGLASCSGGFKKADGGLLYEIHVDKGGPLIEQGDFIALNVIGKRDDDSVLINSYDAGHPIEMVVQKSTSKGDIFSGLEKLAEGDSATIKIDADSMFKKGQRPPNFKGKYLTYDIKIEKVIAKGKLSEQVFEGRVNEYIKSLTPQLEKAEAAKIQKYIAHENLKVTQTPDSLDYVITQQGTGPKPAVGDTAVVSYTGRLLNGKIFDSSIKDTVGKALKLPNPILQANPMRKYTPIHIPVGEKRVIAGWDEGLLLMNKGSKAIFIVPSKLGFGERGAGNVIPPFAPIAFEVELVDIIHPNPNAPKPTPPMMPPSAHMVPPVKK
jgi:FKBP-type peptidyl-prolyl cis-trans isomerase FkpA